MSESVDPTQPVGAVETTNNQSVAPPSPPPVAATSTAVVQDAAAGAVATPPAPEKVAKKERVPRTTLPHQNGVTRPGGGATGKVWEISDGISAQLGAPAPRKAVIEAATAAGINPATIATQYGRWRRFHNLQKEKVAAVPATNGAAESKGPAGVPSTAPAGGSDTTVEAPASK
jgi:hypothetical protein